MLTVLGSRVEIGMDEVRQGGTLRRH
jgi:hypothetical protein